MYDYMNVVQQVLIENHISQQKQTPDETIRQRNGLKAREVPLEVKDRVLSLCT